MELDIAQIDVIHNAEHKRFEMTLGDQLAKVEYQLHGDEIAFTHTGVPSAFEGRGIAGKLAKVALDYAVTNNLRINPVCPYIAAYIKRHPEYQAHAVAG